MEIDYWSTLSLDEDESTARECLWSILRRVLRRRCQLSVSNSPFAELVQETNRCIPIGSQSCFIQDDLLALRKGDRPEAYHASTMMKTKLSLCLEASPLSRMSPVETGNAWKQERSTMDISQTTVDVVIATLTTVMMIQITMHDRSPHECNATNEAITKHKVTTWKFYK